MADTDTEESSNPVVIKTKEIPKVGLAFCHHKQHEALNEIFPEFKSENIRWIYVDTSKKIKDEPDQIVGSMYDTIALDKAIKLYPQGYDYVVMPYCPVGMKHKLRLYLLTAPLLSTACLLKKEGTLIHNNFLQYAAEYLDDIINNIHSQKDVDTKIYNSLAVKLIIAEGVKRAKAKDKVETQEEILDATLNLAVVRRRDRLLATKEFMNKKMDPFIVKISKLAGYKSYQIDSRIIRFTT